MSKFEQALRNPTNVYRYPKDLLEDESLSLDEKLKILQQWKVDAYELMIAEEENMGGDGPTMLSRVTRAIGILKGDLDKDAPYL